MALAHAKVRSLGAATRPRRASSYSPRKAVSSASGSNAGRTFPAVAASAWKCFISPTCWSVRRCRAS
jgi:hypothetical protein